MACHGVVPGPEALHHCLLGRERAVEAWYLLEVFDTRAASLGDVAGVRCFHACQQLAERALTSAVQADDAHALTRLDHQISGAQNYMISIAFLQAMGGDDRQAGGA